MKTIINASLQLSATNFSGKEIEIEGTCPALRDLVALTFGSLGLAKRIKKSEIMLHIHCMMNNSMLIIITRPGEVVVEVDESTTRVSGSFENMNLIFEVISQFIEDGNEAECKGEHIHIEYINESSLVSQGSCGLIVSKSSVGF